MIKKFIGYKVTSSYGDRVSPITGKKEKHTGIDLAKKHKSDINPFVAGEVIYAGEGKQGSGVGGFGNVVLIKDVNGYLHLYAHLDEVKVVKGAIVLEKDVIGTQGNTGKSAGSHLHYEVRAKSFPSFGWKTDIDPVAYLTDLAKKSVIVKVKKGDTLSKIAGKHGLTLKELLKLNKDIKDPNAIEIGQEVIIGKK
jgi:murein DD-endopeptidase MepM/ murein hydrolase activator NlpD